MRNLTNVAIITALLALGLPMGRSWAQGAAPPSEEDAAEDKAEAKSKKGAKAAAKPEGMRTWTAANGDKLEAIFEDMEGDMISFKSAEGQVFKINKRQLSPADQKWIEANKGEGTGAVAEATKPNLLPTFADGKWQGLHAIYQHANFDAEVRADGSIIVIPKDKGKRMTKKLRYRLGCYYHNTLHKPARHTGRPVKEFQTFPQPVKQPRDLAFTGLLNDDVYFELTWRFQGNKITGWGWLKDPDGIRDPTRYRIGISVPASHSFTTEKMSVREELLKDYKFQLRPEKGNSIFYDYHKSLQSMSGTAKTVGIIGPLFGSRKVSIVTGNVRTAPLRPYIYPGYAPWQGYYVGMYKSDPEAKGTTQSITLTIE